MGGVKRWSERAWNRYGGYALLSNPITAPIGAVVQADRTIPHYYNKFFPKPQQPTDPGYYGESFDMTAYMESLNAGMEEQAKAQSDYMAQMSELQKQQLLQQQEQAKAAQVESGKIASDFATANPADAARKQMLRRGLMSTFSRYPNQAGGGKATKLGG